MSSTFLSYADAFVAWRACQRALRRAALTRRYLESLPDDIRKDIGWPDDSRLSPLPQKPKGWSMGELGVRTECPS